MSKGKVVICTPFLTKPFPQFVASLEASVPALEAAGWEHGFVSEIGNIYISNAMNICLRRALDARPDVIIGIDYDLSWKPDDLVTLLETEGDVVGGTYRFKSEEIEYMGRLGLNETGQIVKREDGCLVMATLPSGFLKITRNAVNKFMKHYPQWVYGEPSYPYVDLFHHGAEDGIWFGQDYAFCKHWNDMGEKVWCLPDLNITHHSKDDDGVMHDFPGNYHEYLCSLPGGSKDPARLKAMAALCNREVKAMLDELVNSQNNLQAKTCEENTTVASSAIDQEMDAVLREPKPLSRRQHRQSLAYESD